MGRGGGTGCHRRAVLPPRHTRHRTGLVTSFPQLAASGGLLAAPFASACPLPSPHLHKLCRCLLQVYLLFRARLAPPFTFAAQQPESLEAALFAPHEIPFDELAFSSVAIALRRCEHFC